MCILNRKGVSAFISILVLIATTISVFVVYTFFNEKILREGQKTEKEMSDKDCAYMKLKIKNINYNIIKVEQYQYNHSSLINKSREYDEDNLIINNSNFEVSMTINAVPY